MLPIQPLPPVKTDALGRTLLVDGCLVSCQSGRIVQDTKTIRARAMQPCAPNVATRNRLSNAARPVGCSPFDGAKWVANLKFSVLFFLLPVQGQRAPSYPYWLGRDELN